MSCWDHSPLCSIIHVSLIRQRCEPLSANSTPLLTALLTCPYAPRCRRHSVHSRACFGLCQMTRHEAALSPGRCAGCNAGYHLQPDWPEGSFSPCISVPSRAAPAFAGSLCLCIDAFCSLHRDNPCQISFRPQAPQPASTKLVPIAQCRACGEPACLHDARRACETLCEACFVFAFRPLHREG